MPRKETVAFPGPEGTRYKERLTRDERDRSLIREGLAGKYVRATDARPVIHALARAGEITDADFPRVGYLRYDGVHIDDLDEDDAYMSGNRFLALPDEESTTRGMIEWLMRKVVDSPHMLRRPYDERDARAFDEYKLLVEDLYEWDYKLRTALRVAEERRRHQEEMSDEEVRTHNSYEEMEARDDPGYVPETLYTPGELEELEQRALSELKDRLRSF